MVLNGGKLDAGYEAACMRKWFCAFLLGNIGVTLTQVAIKEWIHLVVIESIFSMAFINDFLQKKYIQLTRI